MILSPDPSSSVVVAVGASSIVFSTVMEVTGLFVLVSNANCWIAQGSVASPPTATAGTGSVYVAAGVGMPISGRAGAKIAVIQDGASSGKACLLRSASY